MQVQGALQRPSRLRALAELEANAASSAEALDRIARIACRLLDVPVVLVNLVGSDRQRFVGCEAPEPWRSVREMPLESGFCPFAVGANEPYALKDARADPTTAANPAVERFGVVAYAGAPLRTADGEAVGTLCAVDYEPREWSDSDLQLLGELADSAIAELQLLAASRHLAWHHAGLQALSDLPAALAQAGTREDVVEAVRPALERLHPRDVRATDELIVEFDDGRTLTDDDQRYLAAVAGMAALALARQSS